MSGHPPEKYTLDIHTASSSFLPSPPFLIIIIIMMNKLKRKCSSTSCFLSLSLPSLAFRLQDKEVYRTESTKKNFLLPSQQHGLFQRKKRMKKLFLFLLFLSSHSAYSFCSLERATEQILRLSSVRCSCIFPSYHSSSLL